MRIRALLFIVLLVLTASSTGAATDEVVLMSTEWADEACGAWNGSTELTEGLIKWIRNDRDRGFKVDESSLHRMIERQVDNWTRFHDRAYEMDRPVPVAPAIRPWRLAYRASR